MQIGLHSETQISLVLLYMYENCLSIHLYIVMLNSF